jgi:hypothetical protein
VLIETTGWEKRIPTTTCSTVTPRVAEADPAAAVMVAVPLATDVTRPAEETEATCGSDDDQVTVAVMGSPF